MKYILPLVFTFITQLSLAQNGPGGIGNISGSSDLVLWLDANNINQTNNTSVSQWSDISGYANNAVAISSKEPTYKANVLNGYPVVDFNASSSEYLYVPNHSSLRPNTISLFVVGKFTSSSYSWSPFVIKATDWDWEDGYSIARWNTYNEIEGYVTEYDKHYVRQNIANNTDYVMSMVYDKQNVELFVNEASAGTDNHSNNINNSNNKMYIGISPDAYGVGSRNPLDGHISEIIMFKSNVNQAQRIIVHNYLSAKYGIDLTAHDVYKQDKNSNGNFDHDVAGIGRVNSSNQHNNSQGTGIIQVSNPSHLQDKEFLMWGHDGGAVSLNPNLPVPVGISSRLNRTWRVSEVKYDSYSGCNVGNTDITVDLSSVPGVTEDNLRLIVDNNKNGDLSDETPISGATEVAAGVFVFANTNALKNKRRFTFAIKNDITWDGNAFESGSGVNSQPSIADQTKNLVIYGSNGVLTTNGSVNNVNITSAGELIISSGKTLVVNGDISNNGTIIIEDGASLVQTKAVDNNSGSGNYTIKRTGNNSSDVYNIWSSPIQNAQLSSIFNGTNPCDLWTFNGTTQSWMYDYVAGSNINCQGNSVTVPPSWAISGGDGEMDIARGYFVPGATSATRNFTGNVNNGTITIPIHTTSLGNNPNWNQDDWNLVGNPFPSAISAASFWTENAIDNNRILDAVYFWDEGDTNSGYDQNNDYATWNLLGGVSSNNTSVVPSGEIASGQGFWIYAATNSNLVFNNSMRTSNNTQFFKTSQNEDETKRIWVAIESPNGYENNILIGFNHQTTDQIENGFDAHKNQGNANIKLASMIGLEEFSIQGIQALKYNSEKEIPLAVFSADSGEHIFQELNREHLNTEYTIFLKDKLEGKIYNLTHGDAVVSLSANINYTERFSIVFKRSYQIVENGYGENSSVVAIPDTSNSTSNTTNIEALESSVLMNYQRAGNRIIITNESSLPGTANIYSINGQLIERLPMAANSNQELTTWSSLSHGVYLIELSNFNGNRTTHKVVR